MRALLLLPLLAASPAFAQDAAPPPGGAPADDLLTRQTVTVGAGIATIPSYEGASSNRIIPIAAARGSIGGFAFSTAGTRLFVDVIRDGQDGDGLDFQLGPIVGFNAYRTRRKTINDARVEALGTLDTNIDVGGYVGFGKTGVITSAYDVVSVQLAVGRDVAGASDSYTITPAVNYGTPLSRKAFVGVSASATYAGGKYNRYYFGISPAGSAASGLAAYSPGSGWKDYTLSGLASYALTGDLLGGFSVVGGVSYSRLLDDAGRSPIVRVAGDRDNWYGAVGLAYTF